jgi:hypothetical protein
MLAQIEKFLAEIPTSDEKICFAMGYDCEMNGADEKNCHFSLFSSPENTKAWEAGKEKARLTKRALDGAKAPRKSKRSTESPRK